MKMTKSTLFTYFANEDGEIHFAKSISPTPMTKCTLSCHVDGLADRADEMLTKTDEMLTKTDLRTTYFKIDPY